MSGSFEIRGFGHAMKRLEGIAERSDDLRPAWDDVAKVFEEHIEADFESHGASIGEAWKPLTAEYVARKRAEGFPTSTLVRTGTLKRSFVSGRYHVEERGRRTFHWGTYDPVAHLHQFGSREGQNPKRPMVKVTPYLRRQVRDVIADHIMGRR